MSDEPDVTVKTVHRKKKPVLLEDIQGNQLSRSSTGTGQAMDLPGYPADPDFQLRGGFANLMLDAANPLFGLVMRPRTLDDLPNIEHVHKTLQTQVSTIREEVQQHGYSTVHLEVYSYALCLYLDEAVMSRPCPASYFTRALATLALSIGELGTAIGIAKPFFDRLTTNNQSKLIRLLGRSFGSLATRLGAQAARLLLTKLILGAFWIGLVLTAIIFLLEDDALEKWCKRSSYRLDKSSKPYDEREELAALHSAFSEVL